MIFVNASVALLIKTATVRRIPLQEYVQNVPVCAPENGQLYGALVHSCMQNLFIMANYIN